MKKKFKAFTLIELIVTMLIMGIIMAGIMRMFQPINDVYSNTSVLSHQEATELGIANYIAGNVKYAQSIGIYQDQASPEAAVTEFLSNHPTKLSDVDGDGVIDQLKEEDVDVICIVNNIGYKAGGTGGGDFYGRIVRKIPSDFSSTPNRLVKTCHLNQSDFDYTGSTGDSYMAMGESYYGTADYYIRISNVSDTGFDITVDSDYYYSKQKKANDFFQRKNATSNYTKLSVYLANPTIPATASTAGVTRGVYTDIPANTMSVAGQRTDTGVHTSTAKNIYIVYYSINDQ